MLDNDMIEFLTYRNAMKSNYRKGVHALRCILNNRKQAETFAGSLGGVSLVLGVSQPDGNSEALRALLEGSAVIDQATLTWLKNWWPEQCGSWDTLAADQGRCSTIATDPFLWERVGVSPVGAGKILAGLVGQDSRNFAAMQAVASSATAMQAVASSATAMQAVAASPVAIAAIYRSDVALSAVDSEVSAAATFYGADSVAMGKAVVILAGLDPAGYADMSAVAASATAMSAVAASATAMSAVAASYVALVALYSNAEALSIAQGTTVGAAALAGAGSVATGKAAVKLAGLDPDDFADMAAVAASSTAMAAVAASSTAMAAVAASATALDALYAKKKRMNGGSTSLSGKFIILEISGDNAFKIGQYGYATLSDGSQPNWDNYKNKYAYFKQFKKYATYMRNDTDGDDWIDYFQVSYFGARRQKNAARMGGGESVSGSPWPPSGRWNGGDGPGFRGSRRDPARPRREGAFRGPFSWPAW